MSEETSSAPAPGSAPMAGNAPAATPAASVGAGATAPGAATPPPSASCDHCGCAVNMNDMKDMHDPSMKYEVGVHYGYLGVTEHFATDMNDLRPGDMVVMKSSRGIDHGVVTTRPVEFVKKDGIAGNVIRRLTTGDHNILEHVQQRRVPEEKEFCIARAKERRMGMKVVAAEHLLGGDKIIFYFIADGRVDFRELVKDLARRYRTRIEMRQIGVRDEARMLSDYEHCGRELCCRTFLRDLEPVTMRMAKMQKSTLDPSKISGHCGRLMCCLRYEDAVYQEAQSTLPRNGLYVTAGEHSGKVVGHDLNRQVEIELADGSRVKVRAEDVRPCRDAPAPDGAPRERGPRGPRPCRDGQCGRDCRHGGPAGQATGQSGQSNQSSQSGQPSKPAPKAQAASGTPGGDREAPPPAPGVAPEGGDAPAPAR